MLARIISLLGEIQACEHSRAGAGTEAAVLVDHACGRRRQGKKNAVYWLDGLYNAPQASCSDYMQFASIQDCMNGWTLPQALYFFYALSPPFPPPLPQLDTDLLTRVLTHEKVQPLVDPADLADGGQRVSHQA